MAGSSRCISRGTASTICLPGKCWETGESPLAKAVLGGKELPDINQVMGYGPARYLLPGEVSQVAHAWANFAISEALEAYHQERAETLKVDGPHHQPEELREMFNQLRDFYGGRPKRSHAAPDSLAKLYKIVLKWRIEK